jgi:Xaa-Pro aminopeptidase. Metallo peptidase. MEROPS family M24B
MEKQIERRIRAMQQWLREKSLEAALMTSPENVFYFSGFFADPHERLMALLLPPEGEPALVLPKMEMEHARSAGVPFSLHGYGDTENPWDWIRSAIRRRTDPMRLAIEFKHMNVERYETLRKSFPGASFLPAEEKVEALRLIKDEKELEKLKMAGEWADYAIRVAVHELREGISERELAGAIEYELRKKGVEKMSFSTTVLTGANAALPHGVPGDSKVRKGDFVLFDLGVVHEGYCSDITRTVCFGEPADEQAKVYEIVLQAQQKAIDLCKPGVPLAELDRVAREWIAENGYGDYFTHRLGHGLGIGIHEYPSVTETNPMPLSPGMVFTIEPGIYIPGQFGVRIEDDVAITPDGAMVLTQYPRTLQII